MLFRRTLPVTPQNSAHQSLFMRWALMPFSNTWRVRKSTIAPVVFKRSIATFCVNAFVEFDERYV
jgi:hypothetical protein